jgi:hypothetical protein
MSIKGIELVLSRAMSDTAFADALFANNEKALADFDLSAEEVVQLKALSRAEFEALAASPEERKSFSVFHVTDNIGLERDN